MEARLQTYHTGALTPPGHLPLSTCATERGVEGPRAVSTPRAVLRASIMRLEARPANRMPAHMSAASCSSVRTRPPRDDLTLSHRFHCGDGLLAGATLPHPAETGRFRWRLNRIRHLVVFRLHCLFSRVAFLFLLQLLEDEQLRGVRPPATAFAPLLRLHGALRALALRIGGCRSAFLHVAHGLHSAPARPAEDGRDDFGIQGRKLALELFWDGFWSHCRGTSFVTTWVSSGRVWFVRVGG